MCLPIYCIFEAHARQAKSNYYQSLTNSLIPGLFNKLNSIIEINVAVV
jgi:hypothetical protein